MTKRYLSPPPGIPRIPPRQIDSSCFEVSTIRPPPPLICLATNLPAFETEKQWDDYRGWHEHPYPVLAKWKCKFCRCWHFWSSGSHTDSNGAFKSDANLILIPALKMIQETQIDYWLMPPNKFGMAKSGYERATYSLALYRPQRRKFQQASL
jgi:hypothetical protein